MNLANMTLALGNRDIAFGRPALALEQDTMDGQFAAMVDRHAKFVYGVAYSILRNAHDAEDAVQDTFLKLYRSGGWQSIDDERAFLARVTWRIAVSRLSPVVRKEPNTDVASSEANPEQRLAASDWNATIHRLIDALPENLRQPLALSTVDELNSRQIAAIMGIPEGTVRTRLMRARQVLKQKLEAMGAGQHAK